MSYLKVLAVRDAKGGAIFAHAVPRKGVDDDQFVVDRLVEDVSWLGYSTLLLKSDNEPAIGKLVGEPFKALGVDGQIEQASAERAVPYDPQSNGNAELGVKLI